MFSLRSRMATLSFFILAAAGMAKAYNSEEHKRLVDRAMADVVVPPSIVFPANTGFITRTTVSQVQAYKLAKNTAVGIQSNQPSQYDSTTKHVQDNSYWVDDGYRQRQYNLVLHIPDTSDLRDRILQVEGRTHNDVRTFTLGELVAFYGDYRRTTWCQNGQCYLVPNNQWTLTFDRGKDCFGVWPFNECGYRPAPVDMAYYLRSIGSGLVPPHGDLGNFVSNTANDNEYTDAGWWGDEMMRISNVNDWHFSSGAAAWYTGMHRLAALYVDSARINPRYWNNVFHYEANALHSLTDLFALGHIVTNRDETSYQVMKNMGILDSSAYRWQNHVLGVGGASRLGETPDYYAGRIQLSNTLPVVKDIAHYRNDWLPSYVYSWWTWALWERNRHNEFNSAGGTVRNLLGETLQIYGDAKFDTMGPGTRAAVSRAVQASVQSLLDGYVALSNGTTTLAELTANGSPLFAAWKHVPVFVENDYSDYFDGMWTRYAQYADILSGAGVVPSDWSNCRMPYMGGSDGFPAQGSGPCTSFPSVASVGDEPDTRPQEFTLKQNQPNPFNPSTVIEFNLSIPAEVTLEVLNVLGQRVSTLASGPRPPGTYTVVWDGQDDRGAQLASGVYFYRLQAGARQEVKKLVLLR